MALRNWVSRIYASAETAVACRYIKEKRERERESETDLHELMMNEGRMGVFSSFYEGAFVYIFWVHGLSPSCTVYMLGCQHWHGVW